ncbi:MAG: phage tail protein [Paracoccaceae bacterium]
MTRICKSASALSVAALCSALMAAPAGAVSFTLGADTITTTTSPTGSSAPVSTMQPSLALTPLIRTSGVFNQLGEVKFFAGFEYAVPGDYHVADGSILSINQNQALFSLLGTTYGGDGRTTFALPDLRGRAVVGSVAGGARMGTRSGAPFVTLNESHLPEHSHTTADSLTTETAGGGQAFDHSQPTIALSYEAVVNGLYPSRSGGGSGSAPEQTMGFVTIDAALDQGSGLDRASVVANGQLLPIAHNTALFSLYGTMYGGDGRSTFALPDTGETLIVGAGSAAGLTPHAVGAEFGAETATLTTAQLPSHSHDDEGTETGATGGGGGFSNVDPSLSMTYLIATQGIYPSSGSGAGSDAAFLGEIALFGGNFVPSGWMQAAGQLLPIAQYSALFSLMGTTYGGDGRSTFALPDLVGRTAIGAGNTYLGLGSLRLGQILGEEFTTLSTAQMAQHDHEVIRAAPVPLPAAGWMLFAALGGLGGLAARRRR